MLRLNGLSQRQIINHLRAIAVSAGHTPENIERHINVALAMRFHWHK